jgi:hypothetical protein
VKDLSSTIGIGILGAGTERDVYFATLQLLARHPNVRLCAPQVTRRGIVNAHFTLTVTGPCDDVLRFDEEFRAKAAQICKY